MAHRCVLRFCATVVLLSALSSSAIASDTGDADRGAVLTPEIEKGYVGYNSESSPYLYCEGTLHCWWAVVANGVIWTWREGYPELESSVFRPLRDLLSNPTRFCKEHRGNDLCRIGRELERSAKKTEREIRRVGDQIGDEATRFNKKIKKVWKKIF